MFVTYPAWYICFLMVNKGLGGKHYFDCPPGFFGKKCNKTCPPGYFGLKCGRKCNQECAIVNCNHVKGCPQSTENIKHVTTLGSFISSRSGEDKQIVYTPKKISHSTETVTLFFPKQSLPVDTFYEQNLLGGAGGAVFLLLLVLVIQFCKKLKSVKRRPASPQMLYANETRDEPTNQVQNLNGQDSYQISKMNESIRHHDHTISEYQKIDECLENENAPALLNALSGLETQSPLFPPCTSFSVGFDVSRFPMTRAYGKPLTQNTCLDMNDSGDYLQPVS